MRRVFFSKVKRAQEVVSRYTKEQVFLVDSCVREVLSVLSQCFFSEEDKFADMKVQSTIRDYMALADNMSFREFKELFMALEVIEEAA
jgi:hypothetical protein